MAAEYQQLRDAMTGAISESTILRVSDQAYVPTDPANRDYQEYLAWEEEPGNDIAPPDPLPDPPAPVQDANARIDAGAQAAVETYQAAPMPPPAEATPAGVQGGLPEIEARLARLETTLQAWVDGQMSGAANAGARKG